MFCLLFLLIIHDSTEPVNIKDMYSTIVHTSLTLESKTFWVSLEGRGAGRTNSLYIFDHGTHQIYRLPTEFVDLDVYCRLFPLGRGFGLMDHLGTCYVFDKDGGFREKFNIKEMEGCLADLYIVEVQHKQGSVVVLTYRDLEKVDDLFMAELDLEYKNFEIGFVKQNFEDTGYWLCRNNTWYFINTQNGEIAELDKQFHSRKVHIPKREPYLAVPDKKIADMLKAQGGSPYLRLIRSSASVGNTTYFWRFHEQTKAGLSLHQLVLKNGIFTLIPHSRLILAEYEGGVLEFNRDEGEYSLVPRR